MVRRNGIEVIRSGAADLDWGGNVRDGGAVEWTGARYADKPTVEVPIEIEASPERVWAIVSDIGVMPGASPELRAVEWLDGGSGPELGARFAGHNRHEAFGEWSTVSVIVECDPPRAFAWAVGDPDQPSAIWRFTLEAREGGTLLRQWVQVGPGRSGLSVAIDRMPDKEQKIVFVRLRELQANMGATLALVKRLAEGAAGAEGAAEAEGVAAAEAEGAAGA
jgi:Polyketide cyclase / dehydrase and lipid transport